MVLQLSGELEAIVALEVNAGRFASADDCVAYALELLQLRTKLLDERLLVEQSLAEAARGELMTEDDVRKELLELEAEYCSSQPAA